MQETKKPSLARRALGQLFVASGAVAFTFLLFMTLPLIQALGQERLTDTELRSIDTGELPPPPPPPPEQEPEQEPEPDEPPPELTEEAPPLDLSQLELAFEPGLGSGAFGGTLGIDLGRLTEDVQDVDSLTNLSGVEQKPRAVYQPGPSLNARLMSKGPGSVTVIFLVTRKGRVENPKIKRSSDPIFEKPALIAVKRWKFDPGRRDGKPVSWHMSQRIQFPAKD